MHWCDSGQYPWSFASYRQCPMSTSMAEASERIAALVHWEVA
jgi:hypothetical protein